MQIKIFGKELFKFTKHSELIWNTATGANKETKFLPDFYQETGESLQGLNPESYIIMDAGNGGSVAVPKGKAPIKKTTENKVAITPKGVYELKMLNDNSFILNTNPEYVEKQISDFKDKLDLIKSEEYDMRRGVAQIQSVVIRMENRKKYGDVKEFFEQFPYTTTSKINSTIKVNDHLKLGQVAQFLADMPKEAVDVMKKYNEATDKVCSKQAVFYIIADKKDFNKTDTRRDPILVAQSPFGHFWQVLGAWDNEMILLESL